MSRHLRSIRALITQYAAVPLVPLSMDGDLSNYKPVSLLAVGQAAHLHLRAYMLAHHVEAVDILETVNKLTLSAMTALQTGFGSPAWRAHTKHAQDVILAGLTRKLVNSISLLDQALHRHETDVYYALSNTQKHHIVMSIANATNLPLVLGEGHCGSACSSAIFGNLCAIVWYGFVVLNRRCRFRTPGMFRAQGGKEAYRSTDRVANHHGPGRGNV